jgi:8-oxo-dGTP pyrophosphatase MutT (NUDIX family)
MRPLAIDPRFRVLGEAFPSGTNEGDDPPGRVSDRLDAAVSVVIRARDELDFLLIKRARSERDPWSGHMALPGGRWDRTDSGLIHTATRETLEETGVDVERIGLPLGRLADVVPSSLFRSKLRIATFVFGVPGDTEAAVASDEVEQVYWIPLDTLRAPRTLATVESPLPDGPRVVPSYRLAGEHVWGLTHRILTHLVELYPESELEELRSL